MKRVNVLPKLSRGFSSGVGQFQPPGLHTLVSCGFALDLALDSLYRSDALYISVYTYVPCFFQIPHVLNVLLILYATLEFVNVAVVIS